MVDLSLFATLFLVITVVLVFLSYAIMRGRGLRQWPAGHPWMGVTLLMLAISRLAERIGEPRWLQVILSTAVIALAMAVIFSVLRKRPGSRS